MIKQRKIPHDSQKVRAKKTHKSSHGGPSQQQASCINQPIKEPSLSMMPDPPSYN